MLARLCGARALARAHPWWHPIATVGPMRQLVPTAADVDPVRTYLAAERPAPPGRPWVALGMIASLDGATAVTGTSGGLGGPADQAVFRAVRAIADVILVAAGTVRAERYRPVGFGDDVRTARADAGRSTEPPRLAIVTARVDLDLESALFTDDHSRPLVLTTTDADPDRVAATAAVCEVRRFGTGTVDLRAALASLADDGAAVVVAEGGPSLNGSLADADVVDELCLSTGPVLAGGDSRRIVSGAAPRHDRYRLASLLTEDDLLFSRWVRRTPTTA